MILQVSSLGWAQLSILLASAGLIETSMVRCCISSADLGCALSSGVPCLGPWLR